MWILLIDCYNCVIKCDLEYVFLCWFIGEKEKENGEKIGWF